MTRPTDLTRAALLPLGALAAGFAFAQASSAPTDDATVLPTVKLKAKAEEPAGKESLQATTTAIGKGRQELRDVPQSVTVLTERLIDDRNLDTLKDALHNAAGNEKRLGKGNRAWRLLRGGQKLRPRADAQQQRACGLRDKPRDF
jgi:catecholate siderophore receptor